VRELSRLVHSADEFERDLIRAAQRDEPGSRALARTLASLGAGLSVAPLAAAAAPNGATKLGALALGKWLVTGMAIGVVTMGGVRLSGIGTQGAGRSAPQPESRGAAERAPHRSVRPSSSSVTSPVEVPPAGPPSAAAPAVSVLVARRSADAEVEGTEARPSGVPGVASGAAQRSFPLEAPSGRAATLDAETNLLDGARRALANGNANAALGLLADYDRAFPAGALRPEASVVRVRALLAAGDRAGAEALGRRIIAAAPKSEHADAIRKWLAQGQERR
jgi:hypothetical protein